MMCIFSMKNKLNLSLKFFSWKSRQEEGLVLQEIQVRGGGLKSDPIPRGVVDFFRITHSI